MSFDSKEVEEAQEDRLNFKDWNGIDEMQSLCMACGNASAATRFFLHKIPAFKELIIASFACEECGERNNEVTFGGEIQLRGVHFEVQITKATDIDRQIVKSDSASVRFLGENIDFEIPSTTQKGVINTIEGLLRTAIDGLSLHQRERVLDNPEVGLKVAEIISKLQDMADREDTAFPFTIILDDPAGNSYIENPFAPSADPMMKTSHYNRSPEQDAALGLDPSKPVYKDDENIKAMLSPSESSANDEQNNRLGRQEVLSLPSPCPNCAADGESLTALTSIPHFKEVIIMSFACKECGFRTNDIKGGGAVPTFGTEVVLRVTSDEDMKRDVLKSDTAMVTIPELELELAHGTLGGVFSTVEGLLQKIYKALAEDNPFVTGDAATNNHSNDSSLKERKTKLEDFLQRLEAVAKGRFYPFTLRVRDPLGNSFISAPLGSFLPPEADPNLELIDFERTFEENEDYGLNDMNTAEFELVETVEEQDRVILPDRLTNPVARMVDHPTPYAKGTYEADDTQGAIPREAIALASSSIPEPPVHRQFSDDSALDYIPREEFSGERKGFVFRLGSKGIGYYEDRPPKIEYTSHAL